VDIAKAGESMGVRRREPPNHLIPRSDAFEDRFLAGLAAQFGTPLFVYDFSLVRESFFELSALLPPESGILYSVKANPSLGVLQQLGRLGAGFEVASIGELVAVERAGQDAQDGVFVGPGKTDDELREALERGVGWLVLDSPAEYERLVRLSTDWGGSTSLAIRLNPGAGNSRGGLLRMSGHTPFGMTFEEAEGLVRSSAARWPIEGFHGYLGTGILEAQTIVENTEVLLRCASDLQARTGARFRFVDVGGGFGIPQYDRDKQIDQPELRNALARLVSEYRRKHQWAERLVFESGRFLSARAGVFLARVVDCKQREEELFVVLDGGLSSLGGRDGYAGARPMPLRVLRNDGGEVTATLCGPLCTPMDRIAARVSIPKPSPGQIVAMFLAGAYAFSASPGLFLSHGYCAEVSVDHGEARLLRSRQQAGDLLRLQNPARS
jgi:diaminopimelate decarboxylase